MDPVQKLWMIQNWIADKKDMAELAKNHAYLIASFDHADQVKTLIGAGNTHTSTEEEFEESSRMVKEFNMKAIGPPKQSKNQLRKKKKRRIIKD
jgi:biotin carboxylase